MSDDIIEVMELSGFDSDGDPEIRREASGKMWLVFNFMPPSWLSDDEGDAPADMGPCEGFDTLLQQAIGTTVTWDDREFFFIENPLPDTPQRIQTFLNDFRAKHEPTA